MADNTPNPKPTAKGGTTSIQARVPVLNGYERKPDRHYVLVESASSFADWYEPPVDAFLAMASPYGSSTEGAQMYKIETEDRKYTGSGRKILLSCSLEDYNLVQKEYESQAREAQAVKTKTLDNGIEGEEELTVSDSALSFPKR